MDLTPFLNQIHLLTDFAVRHHLHLEPFDWVQADIIVNGLTIISLLVLAFPFNCARCDKRYFVHTWPILGAKGGMELRHDPGK